MKKLALIAFVTLSWLEVVAQTEALYSQYYFNKLVINPAYAGSREALSATAFYRMQWTKLDDAPRTFSLSFHSPFKRKQYALGINLAGDRVGPLQDYSIQGLYAYRIFVKQGTLSLGLSANLSMLQLDRSGLDGFNEGDIAFTNLADNTINGNAGAGIYFYGDRLTAGVSVPHFLANKIGPDGENYTRQHFYFTADYLIRLSKARSLEMPKVQIVPSVMLKYVQGADVQLDLNARLVLYSMFWLGGGYRTDNSFILSAEYAYNKLAPKGSMQLRLGYAFDLANNDYRSLTANSHELFLVYEFAGNKNKIITPRYF